MIAQVLVISVLVAYASAGLATSYAVGGLNIGGGLGGGSGLGLGGGIGGIGLRGGLIGSKSAVVDYHTPAQYQFKYGVEDAKTGDRKQQSEVRSGDVVKGEYSLAEADGTIRVVKYTADDHNGFNAVVSRIGHAAHPALALVHGGLGHGY